MNKKIFMPHLFLVLVVMGLSVLTLPLQAYDRQELIDKAAVIIRISNVTNFLNAIEQSNIGKLWNSKELKPFLNNQSLATALKESFLQSIYSQKPHNKELSHLLWEGAKLMKNEVVVGLSPPNQEGKPGFFILAAADDTDYLKSKKIDERMADLDESMSTPHTEVFQGVELIRTDRTRADKVIESSWEAFYEGTVVSSTSREWVERCIVRLKQELPSTPTGPPMLHLRLTDQFVRFILESADRSIPAKQNPEETTPPSIYRCMNKTRVLQASNTGGVAPPTYYCSRNTHMLDEKSRNENKVSGWSNTEGAAPQPPPSVILNALGLEHLKYISLDLFLKPKSMEFQFTIKKKSPAVKGFWTLLSKEHVPLDHRLTYVPDDVYSYQVMRLDFNALWKELPEILESIHPGYVKELNGFSGIIKGMYQIDLSTDVFGNLGTLITTFSRREGLKKQELYAWQVRNPIVMEKLLAKLYGEGTPLAALLQDHLEIQQLHGHKLYSFKTSSINPGNTPPSQPGQKKITGQESAYVGISVVAGALVFGNDKLVRSLILAAANKKTGSMNTLYQLPAYTSLMRTVPDDAVGYSIIDLSQLVQTLFELAKNTMMPQRPEMETEPNQDKVQSNPLTDFFNKLQFHRLPPADFITSFFDKGISYTRFEGNDLVTRGVFQYRERK